MVSLKNISARGLSLVVCCTNSIRMKRKALEIEQLNWFDMTSFILPMTTDDGRRTIYL
jgi:hypothetical protein